MRALLLAAGDGARWGNFLNVPKHFAPIDGEPILSRAVRLLREARPQLDLRVVAPPRSPMRSAGDFDQRYLFPEAATNLARLSPGAGEADKFLSSRHLWSAGERTLLIYGDVYFTEEAIEQIVSPEPYADGWNLFCRFYENPFTGRTWGENFAFGIDPQAHSLFDKHLETLAKMKTRSGGWELYRLLTGNEELSHGDYGHATQIIDWTDDLDTPEDWVQMVARRATRSLE